jgi:aryl-alcohol dehydrogenase-like predicted oxidoreductase
MADRIVIGTVQLGMPYGRQRQRALMSRSDAFAVLDAAWELGVRTFDTAEAYGESAERVAAWIAARGIHDDVSVVTKVVATADGAWEGAIAPAVQRFAGARSTTLLSHNAVLDDRWARFAARAAEAGANAGQSVYDAGEVALVSALPGVTVIQAPANVLDRRALVARGGSTRLDLRSVFLQGLLLERPADAERRVAGAGAVVQRLGELAAGVGEPLAPLLIAATLAAARGTDRVVLGFDEPAQLSVVPAALRIDRDTAEGFLLAVQQGIHLPRGSALLDPRTW